MKLRNKPAPQRNLFGMEPGLPAARWFDGACVDYLGNTLQLQLDTQHRQAVREDAVLHLPLPPDASVRQIQDAAESWLRHDAEQLFSILIRAEAERSDAAVPALSLSFSARGSWTQVEPGMVRVNWRLIEQPLSVIELTLRRAVAMVPGHQASADLFA